MDDGIEVRCASPESSLALLNGDQLEPYGVAWAALSNDRQIGFTYHGNLGISADGGRVGHETNRSAVGRNLYGPGASRFRRQRSKSVGDRGALELVPRTIGSRRHAIRAFRKRSPRRLIEHRALSSRRDVKNSAVVPRDQIG